MDVKVNLQLPQCNITPHCLSPDAEKQQANGLSDPISAEPDALILGKHHFDSHLQLALLPAVPAPADWRAVMRTIIWFLVARPALTAFPPSNERKRKPAAGANAKGKSHGWSLGIG